MFLFLLPGMLCDARLWRHQVAALGDQYSIIIPDISRHDRLDALADDVLAQVPDDAPFVLGGLSMGGYLAFEIIRLLHVRGELERVQKLMLVATSARGDTKDQARVRRGLLQLARKGQFKGVTPKLLPTLVYPGHADDEEIAQTIFDMADAIGREGFIRQETAVLHRRDQRELLAEISCPTLIICGDHDLRTPSECSEEMHRLIPHSDYHLLENCGHLPPLEVPDLMTRLMNEFLEK